MKKTVLYLMILFLAMRVMYFSLSFAEDAREVFQNESYKYPPQETASEYIDENSIKEEAQVTIYDELEWTCPECSLVNNKRFCLECGTPSPLWVCVCGEVCKNKFCGVCGMSFEEINGKLEKAEQLRKDNSFDEAAEAFSSLRQFNGLLRMTSIGQNIVASGELQKTYEMWVDHLVSQNNYEDAMMILQQMDDSEYSNQKINSIGSCWASELISQKRYSEAIEFLAQNEGLFNTEMLSKEAYYYYGIENLEAKKYDTAIECFALADGFNDVEEQMAKALSVKADFLMDSRKYAEARKTIKKIKDTKKANEKMEEYYYKAGVYEYENGNYEAAVDYLGKVKDKDKVRDILIDAYSRKIDMLILSEQYSRAEDNYASLIKLDPEYVSPVEVKPGDNDDVAKQIIGIISNCGYLKIRENDYSYAETYLNGVRKFEEHFGFDADGVITISEYLSICQFLYPECGGESFSKMIERLWDLGFVRDRLPDNHSFYDKKYVSNIKNVEKKYKLNIDGVLTRDEQKHIYEQVVPQPGVIKGLRYEIKNGKCTVYWKPGDRNVRYEIYATGYTNSPEYKSKYLVEGGLVITKISFSFDFDWGNNDFDELQIEVDGMNYSGKKGDSWGKNYLYIERPKSIAKQLQKPATRPTIRQTEKSSVSLSIAEDSTVKELIAACPKIGIGNQKTKSFYGSVLDYNRDFPNQDTVHTWRITIQTGLVVFYDEFDSTALVMIPKGRASELLPVIKWEIKLLEAIPTISSHALKSGIKLIAHMRVDGGEYARYADANGVIDLTNSSKLNKVLEQKRSDKSLLNTVSSMGEQLNEIDVNGDGEITFDELFEMK